MQTLTNGFLKEIYDKSFRHFLCGIDPAIHEQAYVGEHPEPGFAESEFAGKYMDICVRFYNYTGDATVLNHAKRVADSVVQNQREDGYIGGYVQGQEWSGFSVWNQAFTMLGLLSVSEATGQTRYFDAAELCAAYIARHYLDTHTDILDAPNNGSQHLAVLVPMAILYSKTKNELYRDFFEYVFDCMKHSDNNFVEFPGIFGLRSKKAIENFCCLIGMEFYAAQTANDSIHQSVKAYWKEIAKTQIRETGNGSTKELWCENGNAPAFLPIDERPNETCVSVGWAELNAILFQREKEAVYLDEIERTLFNHILGSLDKECRDFAYYQPNFGKRITRTADDVYKCCRYRGYSAIANLPDHLFCEDDGAVIPMIYTNAVFRNDNLQIEETTDYPYDGKIKFTLQGTGAIKLRIPAWCKEYTVTRNGEVVSGAWQNGFVRLDGVWENEEIVLDLHTEPTYKKVNIDGVGHLGLNYGSVVCVLLGRKAGEIFTTEIDPDCPLERREKGEYHLKFQAQGLVDGTPSALEIADYTSAGKNADEEYTVWIKTAGEK